jgi:exonuclease SbcD
MIRILHLADLHLGRSHSYLGDKAAERKREADSLLSRVVDRVLGDPIDVDAVVIAGDLFDTYDPEDSLVGEVMGALRRLVRAGKTVITLPGNHDELSYHNCVYRRHQDRWPGILVSSPEWTRVATVQTEDGPCHFYGIAYQAGITREKLDTSIPLEPEGLHVALLHASVDLPSTDRSIHATSRELGKLGVDYVALGHIHVPNQISLRKGLAVYPGLIEGSGFDDPGRGRLTIACVGDGKPSIEEIPMEARPIETREIDLGSMDGDEELTEAITAHADPGIILRVRLTGPAGFEPSSELISSELDEHFYHLEIQEDFVLMGAGEVEAAAGEETVLGLVILRLKERESRAKTEEEKAIARLALRHAWRAFRGG